MGASNSKPQTVQMSNTSPFQISREALERVENATKAKKGANLPVVCENCSRTTTTVSETVSSEKSPKAHFIQQPVNVASSWTQRSTEIEEKQFSKTLERVHNLLGKPVKWAKANECSADIQLMEQQLISCYSQNGSEPLKCAALANKYHTFVFNKQVASAQNTKKDGHVELKGEGKSDS